MAHPALLESLFRRNSRNMSILGTTKDSDDMSFLDEQKIKARFSVIANTNLGWEVRVVGNIKELGLWNVSEAIVLTTNKELYPKWTSPLVTFYVPNFPFVFEYKYIMIRTGSNHLIWEKFSLNRIANCPEKTSKNFIHEIQDTFNTHASIELKITTKSNFVQALSKIPFLKSLEEQLQELTEILTKELISYNTLALSCIAVKNMKNPVGSNYSSYIQFIQWCSQNITVQQTKILLSATSPSYLWLEVPTSELIEKIDAYQEASQNSNDDIYHLLSLAELRMAFLSEYKTSEDIAGLLISDTYLEKSEVHILHRVINSIEEHEIWKIVIVGMWISQMLFLQSIKPKQTAVMITQFQKLRRQESNEILKDLLSEMLNLVLDVYCELYSKVNHQECEALAGILQSEYKIIHNGIFKTCSNYLLKSIPILNKKVLHIPFICYNSGSARGQLFFYCDAKEKTVKNNIFITEFIPEDFDLPSDVCALVAIFVDSIFNSWLLGARKNNIPVAIGYMHPIIEGDYVFSINDDSYIVKRA